jgi:cobalt-zinc-cadmium efflux system membrane fusion protein
MRTTALLLLFFGLSACREPSSTPPATSEPTPSAAAQPGKSPPITIDPKLLESGRVQLARAEKRAARVEVRLAGEVVPSETGEAEVSTLVAGRVASLDAAEGQRVTKGQLLAQIESPEAIRATSELLHAKSRATLTERMLARQLELDALHATSKNALDEARAADASARAGLAAARTLLSNLGASEPAADSQGKGYAVRIPVRAPIDGVVVKRSAVLGGQASPDAPLFRLVDPERVVIVAKKPETVTAPLDEGAPAFVRPRGTQASCPAHVTRNYRVIDGQRTVPIRLALDGPCPELTVGGYVDVAFTFDAPVAPDAGAGPLHVVVPRAAVIEIKGVSVVFVERAPGKFTAETVVVQPGDGPDAVLMSGVKEGENVVVTGTLLLKGELLRSELGE